VAEGPTIFYFCFEVKEGRATCWKWEAAQPKTSFDGLESMRGTTNIGNMKRSKVIPEDCVR